MRHSFNWADFLLNFGMTGILVGLASWALVSMPKPHKCSLLAPAHYEAFQHGYSTGWQDGYRDAENNAALVGSPDR